MRLSWNRLRVCVVLAVFKRGTKVKKKRAVLRRWTKDDLRLLKSLARDKEGVAKIAKALKRSTAATRVMAAKRGVSLSTRR
jgi:hypothetical protein